MTPGKTSFQEKRSTIIEKTDRAVSAQSDHSNRYRLIFTQKPSMVGQHRLPPPPPHPPPPPPHPHPQNPHPPPPPPLHSIIPPPPTRIQILLIILIRILIPVIIQSPRICIVNIRTGR